MRKYQNLEIWVRSHKLTLDIYDATRIHFPREEMFALTSQIRRASSSIPTNIAEGCGRKSNTDFAHFLQISVGSATEVEYQLLLAKDLHYLNEETYNKLSNEIIEIRKMIVAFIKNIPQSNSRASNLEPGA